MMKSEFSPDDFANFQGDADAMRRYGECFDQCLSFNFSGAVAPLIQDIISDVQEGAPTTCAHGHQCDSCPLSAREMRMSVLLLIDALL